ncbi:hypothetical protein ACKWTF_014120 [Chironomus riparius]
MTTCILCLRQLNKGKTVKLSEPVCDTFTLGDALRQQIRSNILLPYTQSSSQLTCKSCLGSFQLFFKFLTKVNTNLSNFKTEQTFEIIPDCQQVYVPPHVLMLKMEPLILLPRVKDEPTVMLNDVGLGKVDVLVDNEINFEENSGESNKNGTENDNDRFSDDSDFAWSYDDPMDSLDDNETEGIDSQRFNIEKIESSKPRHTKKVQECNKSERAHSNEGGLDRRLNRSNSSNMKDNYKENSRTQSKRSTRMSKTSNRLSDKSEVKVEHSDDECDKSEIRCEDSDKDLDGSDDEGHLLNKRSTRSSQNPSKSTRKSTSLEKQAPEVKTKTSNTSKKTKFNRSVNSTSRTRSKGSNSLLLTSISSKNTAKLIKSENPEVTNSPNLQTPSLDSKSDIKISTTDSNGPLPLFPAKSKTGYIRYLPRDQITLEMINSGQQYIVIDGVEYRIPQKASSTKPKKKSARYTREEDASRRSHPAHDPEGQEKVKNFIDIKCYVCGTEFESFFKLKKHFKRFHPNNQAYLTCCDKNFKRRCDLLDHIEQHERSAVYMCTICNKEYKTKGCLRSHMRFYHPKDDAEQVICYECGKMFNNSNLLKLHLMTHEGDSDKSFECYICCKKFKNIHNVKRHLNLTHALTQERIICHICSASVKKAYLSSHMKYVHNSDRTRVNCERCGIWVLKSTFKTHLMKHTDMGVNCKVCGKFLKSTYSLTSHVKTVHNDKFKFKCNYCDKGFHREVKMQEHIAVKHTRDFPFKCRITECGREFRAEGNCRVHEKKAHPEEYNKFYKPFYKRDNEELKELEEMLAANGT